MITSRLVLAAIAASSLSCPLSAQVMTPSEYVTTAGASDQYERLSAEIVLQTTSDPKVRSFATMMVSAHTKSTEAVKAAAMKSKLKVASLVLMPAQEEMISQLKAENGPARDATYIAQQKAAHGQALSVQKAYASDGTAPALKSAAATIVPVVEEHIAMLMTM